MRRLARTARVLLPATAALFLAACGGGEPTSPAGNGGREVSVTVEPEETTLTALDATRSFSATVTGADGDAEVSWHSSNPMVATVDGSGTATARAPGIADVVAEFDVAADTGRVFVSPEVASVTITPPVDSVPGNGGTTRLSVELLDRNDNAVSGASRAWVSFDTTVATVDSSGLVTGRRLGRVDVEARSISADLADSAEIVVFDPPGDDPPAAAIQSPDDSSLHTKGDTIAFSGSAYDLEDGQLTGGSLVWTSSLDGQIGTGEDVSTSALSTGEHRVSLVATDAGGLADTAAIDVEVRVGVNLVARRLRIDRRGILASETQDVGAVVGNTGVNRTGAFDWSVRVDGAVAATGRVDSIPAGGAVSIPIQAGLGPFAGGRHEVLLEVDTGGEIDETSEGDNTVEDRFHAYPRGFDIELEFLNVADSSKIDVFRQAEARWEAIVTSDLPDVSFSGRDAGNCGQGVGTLDRTVDDLLIFVRLDSIDGEGDVLGQAGPCFIRESSSGEPVTSVVGGMRFDVADLDFLESSGLLQATILHEMGHVLGIGSLWGLHDLRVGAGTSDPVYTGTAGREGFRDVGGDSYDGTPVPIANTGGLGTVDVHWREAILANELMTGSIDFGANPLSLLSVASLRDQFLAVDESQADAYQLPSSSGLRVGGAVDLVDDLLRAPVYGVTPEGTIRRIDRRRLEEPR
jgi:uncharacterized protein YjdB